MVNDMETWTKAWKHVGKDMETWSRTWKHGRGHGNMEEDMETWTRTSIVDMETWGYRHGHMDT